jgi:hypothetical protein
MARHMKPINRGAAFAQGYGEANSADENEFSLSPSFRILWKIIGDDIPPHAIGHKSMKLRPNSWIIVERAHPNRYLRAVRPIAAEQTRTAI